VNWIWLNEGDPAAGRPVETVYFRRTFTIDRPVQKVVDEGTLDITADNAFTVWLNGVEIGQGTQWQQVYTFDVMKHLVNGKNVLAVKATNTEPSPAGLLVRLGYVPNGQDRRALASDAQWKASKEAPENWFKPDFDDSKWPNVKVIGPYGKAGPWRNVAWAGGGDERFTVPEGFTVELAVKPPMNDNFSLVNMCFDAKGRLLVSREGGPVLLCTEPDAKGVLQSVKPYCEQVKNCQGMCWVKDALLLVGDGPKGTGLYRVKDKDGDDKTDEAELLHKFKGGMGEHGPHAILHGPDDWLYLVIGNHAWAQPEKLAGNSPLTRWPTGHFGPDQGRPDTTEDVLLPRLNDSRGHAANILAPGGTIWRLDHEGKNMSLVAAGFRNQFDAAFSPTGELFTFDSDMEWDEALPWYRHVRVCHCPPGADFVWRTGAANTPDYYIDSLPPVLETGRGSPVGVEFYDHHAFPEKYRGALFLADWSIGVIYAVHLKRDGATYKGVAERFCVGAPMNVTDLAVAPDGSLYFTLGGRGTQGGVFRIKPAGSPSTTEKPTAGLAGIVDQPQPLAPYSRSVLAELWKSSPEAVRLGKARKLVLDSGASSKERLRLLDVMQEQGNRPSADVLVTLTRDADPEVRAAAVGLLGVNAPKEAQPALENALTDKDALVRRRACEGLVRAGIEPPVEVIWPLLADPDRFVRHAARLVVERMDPKKWAGRIWTERNHLLALNGIVALCQTNQAMPYTEQIFEKLHNMEPDADNVQAQLDYLRTLQLALIHTTDRPGAVRGIALECLSHFPNSDWRVNRELAILLTEFRRSKVLDEPIHAKLLEALLKCDDRAQQIHYFYCLRLLHDGWTQEQKDQLLAWFDSTKTWTGGHSFMPFLEHILRDLNPIFTREDRSKALAAAAEHPWTAAVLLRYAPGDQAPTPNELAAIYKDLLKPGGSPQVRELKESIMALLLRNVDKPDVEATLTELAAADPSQLDQIARNLARRPNAANWPILVRGLQSNNPDALLDIIRALRRLPRKAELSKEPKPEEATPYRLLILAAGKLPPQERLKAVELLRHWKDQKFAVEPTDWKGELEGWSRWFAQTFPKEPSLPNVTEVAVQSKWKMTDLLPYLESAQGQGDANRGKAIFEKANCIKCHKYGSIGEGLGPDLTTLKSRFKRADTLEALIHPSKVISDQYRGTKILTKDGATITGLAAPQGGMITVLQLDGTKVTLKVEDIEVQVASTISPMPEKLLDELTREEIADLFAYLESTPPK
jgi:putative heme-binding domain-containing protein